MSSDSLQPFRETGQSGPSSTKARLERQAARWRDRPPMINEIAHVDYLLTVHDHLRQHGGQAPGVDGVTYHDLSRSEAADALRTIAAAVRTGAYVPQAQRSLSIPKSNGKLRRLSLPVVLDRVMSAGLQYAVSPTCERHFHDRSFGFRPQRGTWTLLAQLEVDVRRTQCFVFTQDDVRDAFPSVSIDQTMDCFRPLLPDPALGQLIEVVMRGATNHHLGLSQGCPFSPLALNVLLNVAHDRVMAGLSQQSRHDTTPSPSPLPAWFRYADNLAYLTKAAPEGHQILVNVRETLQPYGLTLKGPGVPVDLRNEAVEMLGLTLRWTGHQLRYTPGSKAWTHLEEHLVQAHETNDPSRTARRVLEGWILSLGPVFENRTDEPLLTQIREIAVRHGFREIYSWKDLQHFTQKAGHRWRAYRQGCHEQMGKKGEGRVKGARIEEKTAAPPAYRHRGQLAAARNRAALPIRAGSTA